MVLLPSVDVQAGQELFEARHRCGLTLDDISRTTKIPVSLLRAIERNDFDRLPQGFFTRAFVRTYAAEVGLDADHILESFDRAAIDEVPRLDSPVRDIPEHEPASSKSLLMVVALCAALTMFYSRYASQTAAPVVPDRSVASVSTPADPITTVSNASACPDTSPAVTPVQPSRRKDPAAAQTRSAPRAIPVTHVDEDATADPEASDIAPSPAVSDAVLPQPDVVPSPEPVEQF